MLCQKWDSFCFHQFDPDFHVKFSEMRIQVNFIRDFHSVRTQH